MRILGSAVLMAICLATLFSVGFKLVLNVEV